LEDTAANKDLVLRVQPNIEPIAGSAEEPRNQQEPQEFSPADPVLHQQVSTVETDPEDPPATQPAPSVRKQLQAAASIESKAAKLGLTIRKNTDLRVIKGVLLTLAESNRLSKRVSKSLRSVDFDNRDAVLDAWCELADVFKDQD
jgi:predicted KAP-like P-loop ATPase